MYLQTHGWFWFEFQLLQKMVRRGPKPTLDSVFLRSLSELCAPTRQVINIAYLRGVDSEDGWPWKQFVVVFLAFFCLLQTFEQVRKTPSWPRSWANCSLLSLHSHGDAWANWHIFGPT